MKIRKAKLKDLREISEISKESIKFHSKYETIRYDVNKIIPFYTAWLEKLIQKNVFLVTELDKRVVGYVCGDIKEWYPDYKIGSVIDLAVKKEYQGKGIGKKLLNSIVDLFKEKNCKEIKIDVHMKNKKAFNLYKSLGFGPWKYEMKKIIAKV